VGTLESLVRALIRDDRGMAVAEYGMIVTILSGLVIGLMNFGVSLNGCIRGVGMLLIGLAGQN